MGRSGAVIGIMLMMACSHDAHHELLVEAAAIHESSVEISERVEQELGRVQDKLQKRSEELPGTLMDSVKVLNQQLLEWKENLMEVPGHEHEEHEHSHDHDPLPDLTPEMVLDIQQELNKQIVELSKRTSELLQITHNKP